MTDPEYMREPDEDVVRAITAKELLVGIKEDIREISGQGKR